tara:strand:- start:27788 stop:28138 length:351 start_codon:yes stop_codon:yes gene_type:complete
MAYIYIITAAVLSTAGNIFLKISRENLLQDSNFIDQYINGYFFLAITFYVLNVFLFSRALDTMQVNIGYPMLAALGFTFLSISSWFFLGEKLQLIQVIGMFAIILGIILLSYQSNS